MFCFQVDSTRIKPTKDEITSFLSDITLNENDGDHENENEFIANEGSSLMQPDAPETKITLMSFISQGASNRTLSLRSYLDGSRHHGSIRYGSWNQGSSGKSFSGRESAELLARSLTTFKKNPVEEVSKRAIFSKIYQKVKEKSRRFGISFRNPTVKGFQLEQRELGHCGSMDIDKLVDDSKYFASNASTIRSRVSSSIRYPNSVMQIYMGTEPEERDSILQKQFSLARPKSVLTFDDQLSFPSIVNPESDVVPIRIDDTVSLATSRSGNRKRVSMNRIMMDEEEQMRALNNNEDETVQSSRDSVMNIPSTSLALGSSSDLQSPMSQIHGNNSMEGSSIIPPSMIHLYGSHTNNNTAEAPQPEDRVEITENTTNQNQQLDMTINQEGIVDVEIHNGLISTEEDDNHSVKSVANSDAIDDSDDDDDDDSDDDEGSYCSILVSPPQFHFEDEQTILNSQSPILLRDPMKRRRERRGLAYAE